MGTGIHGSKSPQVGRAKRSRLWYAIPMRAYVRLETANGEAHELGHGDVIGRLWSVALPISDPRVSEMHAMISLRGSSLRVLPLRGRIAVDGAPVVEARLVEGQVLSLADDLTLRVREVVLPDEVMALEGEGLARQVLPGVCSLRVGARVELAAGHHPQADAVLWSDGLRWHVRVDRSARELKVGDTFEAGGRRFVAAAMALGATGAAATQAAGGLGTPVHIVVRFDTAHLYRGDDPPLALDGISARIVSELATIGKPVSWEALAREIWRDEEEAAQLRKRWDVALVRLRKKLGEARIRRDLIRADGTGNVELFLGRGDTLVDQT